jgi:hypothetical protein
MPTKFEKDAIELTKVLFEDRGVLHAQALFRSAGKYSTFIIETVPAPDQIEYTRLLIGERRADAYAVSYLVAKVGSDVLAEDGVTTHDFVIPSDGIVASGEDHDRAPEKKVFVFSATKDGRTSAYSMDVVGPKELGPAVDVSGEVESPFADLYRRDPKRQAYGSQTH